MSGTRAALRWAMACPLEAWIHRGCATLPRGENMNELWYPADVKDHEQKLRWAASGLLDTSVMPVCPLCKESSLRFYYHEFGIVKLNRRRGTIWIWCNSCKVFDHMSGVRARNEFVYRDPLTVEDFNKIDNLFLIQHLNKLWEKSVLPKKPG
jgi:hypothetical protein